MIVLDASALVDIVLDLPPRDAVLAHLDQPICAPAHQSAEVLSAISRLVRAGEIDLGAARGALDEAGALDQELVTATSSHLRLALDLQDRIRVLDGLYVALAAERNCQLVTTDAGLAGADPPCEIVLAA